MKLWAVIDLFSCALLLTTAGLLFSMLVHGTFEPGYRVVVTFNQYGELACDWVLGVLTLLAGCLLMVRLSRRLR